MKHVLLFFLLTCGICFFIYVQKEMAFKELRQLQFIGWLKPENPHYTEYFLWFQMVQKTFMISRSHVPNGFQVFNIDAKYMKNNKKIIFNSKKYYIVFDK